MGSWYTSDRRQRLPPDWPRVRAQVRERAHGLCQAKHHARGCDGWGTDCDHIEAGDDHRLANLQWLSGPCHRAKTARETIARNKKNAKLKKHPVEKNPGQLF